MNPESSSTASFDTSLFVVASIGVKHPVFITATSSHAIPLNDDMHGNDASRSVNDDVDDRCNEDDDGNCEDKSATTCDDGLQRDDEDDDAVAATAGVVDVTVSTTARST